MEEVQEKKKEGISTGAVMFMILASIIIATVIGVQNFIASINEYSAEVQRNGVPGGEVARVVSPETTQEERVEYVDKILSESVEGFDQFGTDTEFLLYLDESRNSFETRGGFVTNDMVMEEAAFGAPEAMMAMDGDMGGSVTTPTRVSETNVQVVGIDEPDIVKTNGSEIFVGQVGGHYWAEPMPMPEPVFFEGEDRAVEVGAMEGVSAEMMIAPDMDYPYREWRSLTKVVDVFPPEDMELLGHIEESGNLLLSEDTLIILKSDEVVAYDVSDPAKPTQAWNVELGENSVYQDARLMGGELYLITRTNMYQTPPCPLVPFTANGKAIEVACGTIYHPLVVVPVDATYHVAQINAETGALENTVSYVGSYDSTIYMSANSLYVAYVTPDDTVDFVYGFMVENADLFGADVVQKIAKLRSYDISRAAKMMELQVIIDENMRMLDRDDQLRIENEMNNRMVTYYDNHKRELTRTSIVRIGLDGLSVKATGSVPGRLLNQFAMDEYDGNLRVAVTVGEDWWGIGMSVRRAEANDIYVLNSGLEEIGSVIDLGEEERIYSVRFMGDRGYMVTFRQIDPFFVLDLSDPKSPTVEGELKIPGYSSYLHPLGEHSILGIGKEGSQVKLSLFDVSDPKNPKEVTKYQLKEYWSEVLNTHHAFLHDDLHDVFFMPGNQGGYVFGYTEDTLTMKKAVSGINAQRAIYLDDYLYIVGTDKIVVLDENTWERVSELSLTD